MRSQVLVVAGAGVAPNQKAICSTVHMYELFGLHMLT